MREEGVSEHVVDDLDRSYVYLPKEGETPDPSFTTRVDLYERDMIVIFGMKFRVWRALQ